MTRRQEGLSLVAVLVLMVILTMLAGAFVWQMNRDQGQVGRAQRATSALYLAEAGAEKALWHLSQGGSVAPPTNKGSLEGYQEEQGQGRFVIERIVETPEGAFEIVVRGEVGEVVRRIRVTARLVPKALGFGLYAGDVAALMHQARLYVIPFLQARKPSERFGDVAVARWLWVEDRTSLNHLDGQKVPLREGPVYDYALFGLSSSMGVAFREREILPDLVATADAPLAYGRDRDPLYDLSALRFKYPAVHVRALRSEPVTMPRVDLERYRTLARENRENAALNRAVGERMRDRDLADKKDSLYTQQQFERMLWHLDTENRGRARGKEFGLAGVVFVEGIVTIRGSLRIDEGALVVRGIIGVMERARLEVRHGPSTTALPGVIAFGDGGRIRLAQEAAVVVDGIVLAGTGLEVVRASLDVSGAILTGQGLLNDGGLVVVRYNPGVLTTIGLSRTEHVLIRPMSWQEVH